MILGICDNPSVLSVMRIVNIAILIIKIAVPILLILTGMITLMKTIKVGNEDLLAKAKKQLVSNTVAAVAIFLVPTLVSVLVKVSLTNGEYKDCLGNTSNDVINQKYYDRAVDSISKAESSSKYNDYYDAVNKVSQITDKDTKDALNKRLESIKSTIDKKIDEDNKKENTKNENGSTSSPGTTVPDTGEAGTFTPDAGKTYNCNKNGKYQLCSPKKGVFGSFAFYDKAAPNDTSNRNSIEMDPAWRRANLTRVTTECSDGTKYSWTVHKLAVSTWKKVQEKFCEIITVGIDGIKYAPNEIVVSGPVCVRYLSNTKTVSPHSYGTAIDINPGESYVIDGKTYPRPYGRSLEKYNNFINALGSEEDIRNVNYVLWKKVFEPLGFIWGGHWGRDGKGAKIDGMHFEIDWRNAKK